MADPTPTPETTQSTDSSGYVPPTPLRCFTGSIIAGAIATALYYLTASIAETFANKPLPTSNQISINIAIAVRTLVVGMSTMGTAVFAIATVGLFALGIKLLIEQFRAPNA